MPQIMRFMLIMMSLCYSLMAVGPFVEEAIVIDPDNGEIALKFSGNVERSGGGSILTVSDFVYTDNSTSAGANVTAISAMGADSDASDGEVVILVDTAVVSDDFMDTIAFDLGAGLVDMADGTTPVTGNAAVLMPDNSAALTIEIHNVNTGPISAGNQSVLFDLEITADSQNSYLDKMVMEFKGLDSNNVAFLQFDDLTNGGPTPIYSDLIYDDMINSVGSTNTYLMAGNTLTLAVNVSLDSVNPLPPNFEVVVNTESFEVDGMLNGGTAGNLTTGLIAVDNTSSGNSNPYEDIVGNFPTGGNINRVVIEHFYDEGNGFGLYLEVLADSGYISSVTAQGNAGGAPIMVLTEDPMYPGDWEFETEGSANLFVDLATLQSTQLGGASGIDFTFNTTEGTFVETIFPASTFVTASAPNVTNPDPGMDPEAAVTTSFTVDWDIFSLGNVMEVEVDERDADNTVYESGYLDGMTNNHFVNSGLVTDAQYSLFVSGIDILSSTHETFGFGDDYQLIVQDFYNTTVPITTGNVMSTPMFTGDVLDVVIDKIYDQESNTYLFRSEVVLSANVASVDLFGPNGTPRSYSLEEEGAGIAKYVLDEGSLGSFSSPGDMDSFFGVGGNYVLQINDHNTAQISFETAFDNAPITATANLTGPADLGAVPVDATFVWDPITGTDEQSFEIINDSDTTITQGANTITVANPSTYVVSPELDSLESYSVKIINTDDIVNNPSAMFDDGETFNLKLGLSSIAFYTVSTSEAPNVYRLRLGVNRDDKESNYAMQDMYRFRVVVLGNGLASGSFTGNALQVQQGVSGNSLYFETHAMPSANIDTYLAAISGSPVTVNFIDSSSDSYLANIGVSSANVSVSQSLEIDYPKDNEGIGERPTIVWSNANISGTPDFNVVKIVDEAGSVIHVAGTSMVTDYIYPADQPALESMDKYEVRVADIHVQSSDPTATSAGGDTFVLENSVVYDGRVSALQTETLFGAVDIDGGIEELSVAYIHNSDDNTYQFQAVLLADVGSVVNPILTAPGGGGTIMLEQRSDKVFTYRSAKQNTAADVLDVAPAGTYTFSAVVGGQSRNVAFEMIAPTMADIDASVQISNPSGPEIIDVVGPYNFDVSVASLSAVDAFLGIIENNLNYPNGVFEGQIFQPANSLSLDHEEFGADEDVILSVMSVNVQYKSTEVMDGDEFRIFTGMFSRDSEALHTPGTGGPVHLAFDPGFAPTDTNIEGDAVGVEVLSFILSTDAGDFASTIAIDQIMVDVDFPNSSDISTDFTAATLLMPSGNTSSGTINGAGNVILFSSLSSEVAVEPGFPQNLAMTIDLAQFPAFGEVSFSLAPESVSTVSSGNAYGDTVDSFFNVGSVTAGSGNILARAADYEVDPQDGSLELGVAGNVDLYFSYVAAPTDTGFDKLEISLPDQFYNVSLVDVAIGGNVATTLNEFVAVGVTGNVIDEGLGIMEIDLASTYANSNSGNVFRVRIEGTAFSDSNQGLKELFLTLLNTSESNFLAADPNDGTINAIVDPHPTEIFVNPPVVTNNNLFEARAEISSANLTAEGALETNSDATLDVYIHTIFDGSSVGINQLELFHPDTFNENDMSGNAGIVTGLVTLSIFDNGGGSFVDASSNVTVTRRYGSLQLNTDYVINGQDTFFKLTFDAFTGNVATNQPFPFAVDLNNTSNLGAVLPAISDEAQPAGDTPNTRSSLELPFILGSGAPEGPSLTDLFYEIDPLQTPRTSSDIDIKTFVYYNQGSGSGFDKMYVGIPHGFAIIPGSIYFSFDAGTTFVSTGFSSTIEDTFLDITFDSDQVGSANVQLFMTVSTPENPTFDAYFNVEVEKTGRLNSYKIAEPSDLNNDGFARTSINVTEAISTFPNVSDIYYEAQARDAFAGNLQFSVDTDSNPYWHVFINPLISSSANDQGFNRILVQLEAEQFELGANNPSDVRIYSIASNDVSTSANWQQISDNVTFPAQDDVNTLQVNFTDTQTDDDLTYVVAFRKRVPGVSDFVGVTQVGLNNTNNPGGVFVGFNPNVDVDGDSTINTFGFPVNSTQVFEQDPVSFINADLESASANVFINETASYSLYLQVEIDNANNTGFDRIDINYPPELTNPSIEFIASSSSSNLTDGVLATSDYVQSSFYDVDNTETGRLKITLQNKITNSGNIRIDFFATAPSQPLFADLFVQAGDTSTGRINTAPPYPLIGDEGSLAVEVRTNVVIENLSEVLTSATTELIVVPDDSTYDFVVPGSRPKMSFVLSTTQTADEAGFDIIDIYAAPGFELPISFDVYRSANTTNLADSSTLLDPSEYEVNTASIDQGFVKIKFNSVQSFNLIGSLSGFTPGQAYYRVEFSPTAPPTEMGRVYFGLEVTNTTNDRPAPISIGNVMNGSDLYPGETSLDLEDTGVDVFVPFIANAKDPVSALFGEASVIDSSGNKSGFTEVSTDAELVIDFAAYISDNVNINNGFDRVILTLPDGFGTPSDISLVRYQNTGSSLDFSANLLVTSSYDEATRDLIISIVGDVENQNGQWNYELSMRTLTSQFPGFVNIPKLSVDYSQESNEFLASNGDADESVVGIGSAPNNVLAIDLLQAAIADDQLATQYSPVVDDLVLEIDPSSVTSGTKGAEVRAYFKANNLNSQRGFDYLVLQYPYLLNNITNIEVFQSTDGSTFSQMDIGLGLSSVAVQTDFSELQITFSEKVGIASDITIKVVFTADFPDATGDPEFYGRADIVGVNFPSPARPGNATGLSSNDSSRIFVEPDASLINFDLNPLQVFSAEIVGGNAISGNYIEGDVVAENDAFIDIYMHTLQGPTSAFTGFTGMEIQVPFPMDAGQLKSVTVSSSDNSSYSTPDDFTQIPPNDLEIFNSASQIQIGFESDSVSQGDKVFRIRMRIEAPEFAELYRFNLAVFSSNNQGIFQEPVFERVTQIAQAFTPNDSNEVQVIANLENIDLSAVFAAPLVSSLIAEVAPAFVPEGSTNTYTIYSRAEFEAGDRGFNRIIVNIPDGFGEPGGIKLAIDGADQQPNAYTTITEVGRLGIELVGTTITTSSNISVSFDASAPAPDNYEFKMEVRNTNDALSFVPAGFGDVVNDINTDSGLFVYVYPDFSAITFVDPVDDLNAELNASRADGASTIVTNSLVTVDYFIEADFLSGTTASGFDTLKFEIPPSFGEFPSTLSVNVDTNGGSANFLVQGSVSGYSVDLDDPYRPVINFGQTYTAGTNLRVTFDITAPSTADIYQIYASVEKSDIRIERFVNFGYKDLDGDSTDDNRIGFSVFRDTSIDLSNFFVVEDVFAEVNTVDSGDIFTDTGVELQVSARSINTGSGNGFNKIGLVLDSAVAFGDIVSLTTATSNLVRGVDYFVDANDPSTVFLDLETTLGSSSNIDFDIVFTVNTPSEPTDIIFGLGVDNTALDKVVFAIPTKEDDSLANFGGSNDSMRLNVIKDYSDLLTGGVVTSELLTSVVSEALFVDANNQEVKTAEALTTTTVRVYVKPEVSATDLGITRMRVHAPFAFSQPSNIEVYVNGTFSTNVERNKLEAANVDYSVEVNDENQISIDFGGAQRTTYNNSGVLLKNTAAGDNITSIEIEFTSQLPEDAKEYFIGTEVDNESLNLPRFTGFGDVNGNNDDNNDGVIGNIGDDEPFVRVTPVQIDSSAFAEIVNASSLNAEITSVAVGEAASTADVSITMNAEIVTGSDNGINRLIVELPDNFSSVSDLAVSAGNIVSGNFSGNALIAVNDYSSELDDVTNLKVILNSDYSTTTAFVVSFKVVLPQLEDPAYGVKVYVDNVNSPKRVSATPNDVVDGGTNDLVYAVDPVSITADQLDDTLLTTLTARAGRIDGSTYTPLSIVSGNSDTIDFDVTATFSGNDLGFDRIKIESSDYSEFNEVTIVRTISGVDNQLFRYSDFDTYEFEGGIGIEFFSFISTQTTELKISVGVTAKDQSAEGRFKVEASSSSLPFFEIAELSGAAGDTLSVPVLDPPKSADELQARAALPVSELLFDLTPGSANVNTIQEFAMYIEATSSASSNLANGEIIPANTGFDQVMIDLSSAFGDIIDLEVYDHSTAFNGANVTLLQSGLDYDFSQLDTLVTVDLFTDLLATSGNEKIARFSANLILNTPAKPGAERITVSVDNSAKPNEVPGSASDLDSDNKGNNKVVVKPSSTKTTLGVTDEARASLVLEVSNSALVQPEVSESSFAYKVRIDADNASGYSGFDMIELAMPSSFNNGSVAGVSTSTSGNLVPLIQSSTGYQVEFDPIDNIAFIFFGETQQTNSSDAVDYYEISLIADMPPEDGTYYHTVSLRHYTEGFIDVSPAYVLTDSSETGNLSLEVVLPGQNNAKVGFYGTANGSIIDSLAGSFQVWDEANSAFAQSVASTDSPVYNVVLETTPVFSGSSSGFDYLKIELPYGTGEPVNTLVAFQSTTSGNLVYLEEFYDYRIRTTPSAIIIQFVDETGSPVVVNETLMGSTSNGIFSQKLGFTAAADKMLVNFDIQLPRRLGRHYFDAYVLNTDSSISEIYYMDSTDTNNPRETVIGGNSGASAVQRTETKNGTRFSYIEITNGASTAAVSGLTAEIVPVGGTTMPVNDNRQMVLDVAVDLSAGASDQFDQIEFQLPFGFESVTNFVLSEYTDLSDESQLTMLEEFIDYTADFGHDSSVMVTFLTPIDGGTFTTRKYRMAFNLQTPTELGDSSLTQAAYTFGVVASLQEDGVLSKSAVYATGGDVVSSNASSSLAVDVQVAATISGTVVLENAAMEDLLVTAEMMLSGTTTVLQTKTFIVDAGGNVGTFQFDDSDSTDQTVSIAAGTYQVVVNANQYNSQTINNLVIVNSQAESAITNADTTLTSESVQATGTLSISTLPQASTNTITLTLNTRAHSSYSSLNMNVALNGTADSSGNFSSYSVTGVSVGGTALSSSLISSASSGFDVDLSGETIGSAGTSIVITLQTTTAETQDGLFDVATTFTLDSSSSSSAYLASTLDTSDARILLNVGDKAVRLLTTTFPDAVIGAFYSSQVSFYADSTITGSPSFSISGLTGFSIDSTGTVSGTSSLAGDMTFTITATFNGDTDMREYSLTVVKGELVVRSIQPKAVPTTGGYMVIKGSGFTAATEIQIDNVTVDSTKVTVLSDLENIVVELDAASAGTYAVTVIDGDESFDVPTTFGLVRAETTTLESSFYASIEEGQAPDSTDFEILGIQGFYQDSIYDVLVSAFGPVDNTAWRAFNANNREVGVNINADDQSSIAPGQGFWLITRAGGNLSTQVVSPDAVDSYAVTLLPDNSGWNHVANMFDVSVSWSTDVTVISGNTSDGSEATISAAGTDVINQNLYGMDPSATAGDTTPYTVYSAMDPGRGYWVQNKTGRSITMIIRKPTSISKAKPTTDAVEAAEPEPVFVSFKADEDEPPEVPVSFQKSGTSASGGGGGGCLLK